MMADVVQIRKELDELREARAKLPPQPPDPPDRGTMDNRLTSLEVRLESVLPTLATKSDISEIRTDVQKIGAELHRWMLATVLTIIGTLLAALFGLNQANKQSLPVLVQQPSQPPVIINIPGLPQATAPVHQPGRSASGSKN